MLKRRAQQSGFTLLETVIAVGITLSVLSFAGAQVKQNLQIQALARKHDVIAGMETKLRLAFKNPSSSFTKNKAVNKPLRECLDGEGAMCSPKPTDLEVWLSSGEGTGLVESRLTGDFDANGRPCLAGCAFTVKVQMEAICPDSGTCDEASGIYANYSIFVSKTPVREGSITVLKYSGDVSDDNQACGLDPVDGSVMVVRGVSNGTVTCESIPKVSRTLTGVLPGTCKDGEVLVGFKEDGSVLCEAVFFGTRPPPPPLPPPPAPPPAEGAPAPG